MSLMYPEPAPSLFGDDSESGSLGRALRAAGRTLAQPLRALHEGRLAALELRVPDDRQLGDFAEHLDAIEAALTGRSLADDADPAQLTLDLPAPRTA